MKKSTHLNPGIVGSHVSRVCACVFVNVSSSRQRCGPPVGLYCFLFGPGGDGGAGYDVQGQKRKQ